jgi:hypothetical protein
VERDLNLNLNLNQGKGISEQVEEQKVPKLGHLGGGYV